MATPVGEKDSPRPPPRLPIELLRRIADYVPCQYLPFLCRVSRDWARLWRDDVFWRARYQREIGEPPPTVCQLFWPHRRRKLLGPERIRSPVRDNKWLLNIQQIMDDPERLIEAFTQDGVDVDRPILRAHAEIAADYRDHFLFHYVVGRAVKKLRPNGVLPAPMYSLRDCIWITRAAICHALQHEDRLSWVTFFTARAAKHIKVNRNGNVCMRFKARICHRPHIHSINGNNGRVEASPDELRARGLFIY